MPYLLAVFLFIGSTVVSAQSPGPQIVPASRSWDFGSVLLGTKLEKRIVIENRGDAPLRIEKVRSTCGCARARVESTTVAAGGRTELVIEVDGVGARGRIEKKIILECNDPQDPATEVAIRGTIEPIWWTTSHVLRLGAIRDAAKREIRIPLFVREGHEVRITRVVSSAPTRLESRVEKADGEARPTWTVVLTLKPNQPLGEFRIQVGIYSDLLLSRHIGVELHGEIVGKLKFAPKRLSFGRLRVGTSGSRRVRISGSSGLSVRTLSSSPLLAASVSAATGGADHEVLATMTPTAAGDARGKLIVIVGKNPPRRIEIPWSARCVD